MYVEITRRRTLSGAKLFRLSAPADATVESAERDALLVLDNVLQVLLRPSQGHTFDSTCGLMGILKRMRDDRSHPRS